MDPQRVLFQIGRSVLGPIFCCYVATLAERARALGIERLHFVAREGALFRRLYDTLVSPSERTPHAYLYVSRLSTSLPSVHAFGLRELHLGFMGGPGITVEELLARFDLADEEMLAHAYAAGFVGPFDRILDWWEDIRLTRLLADEGFTAAVTARASRARSLLRRYLAQEGLFSVDRAALVDIGWAGTIQNSLVRAFSADPEFPMLWGLYFGLGAGAFQEYEVGLPSRKEGLIVDWSRDRGFPHQAVFSFLTLFEEATRAAHGTTTGYEDRGGVVTPITNESGTARAAERATQGSIEQLQLGMEACAADFPRWLTAHGGSLTHALPDAWQALERFIFLPSAAELEAIAQLAHSEDWGRDGVSGLVSSGPTLLRGPRRWLQGFHQAYWKPGYLRLTGGPLFCRIYHQYSRFRARPA